MCTHPVEAVGGLVKEKGLQITNRQANTQHNNSQFRDMVPERQSVPWQPRTCVFCCCWWWLAFCSHKRRRHTLPLLFSPLPSTKICGIEFISQRLNLITLTLLVYGEGGVFITSSLSECTISRYPSRDTQNFMIGCTVTPRLFTVVSPIITLIFTTHTTPCIPR